MSRPAVARSLSTFVCTWLALIGCSACQGTDPDKVFSRQGCEVAPGGPGGPITDPSGPYYHQVVVADAPDGVTLSRARQVLDHASVPDGARRVDGSVLVYYVNGAEGFVWVARLSGDSAVPLGPIALDGVPRPAGVVDPDVTTLPGGRLRLAYLSGFGPPSDSRVHTMCLAESEDGISFTVLGAALRFEVGVTATDPSLTQLADGSWLMAVSWGQRSIMARSNNGLTFTRYDTLWVGGVPELATLPDGRIRLYVCAQGIVSFLSSDRGTTWQPEKTVVAPGTGGKKIVCDPSSVAAAGLFLYKTAD